MSLASFFVNNQKLAGVLLEHFGVAQTVKSLGWTGSAGRQYTSQHVRDFDLSRERITKIGKRAGHDKLTHILVSGDREQLAAFL